MARMATIIFVFQRIAEDFPNTYYPKFHSIVAAKESRKTSVWVRFFCKTYKYSYKTI